MSDGSSMDEKTSGFDSELYFDEESRQEESRRDKLEFMGIDMGSFCFGFELDNVKELVRDLRVTKVPCLPEYYEGVCNWKGNIIPIVSLRRAGGLAPLQDKDNVMQALILVTKAAGLECGFLIETEPQILNVFSDRQVEGELPDKNSSVLTVGKIFEGEDKIVAVINLEESLGKMVVYE